MRGMAWATTANVWQKGGRDYELREWFTLKSPNKDKGPHHPPPSDLRLTPARVSELRFTDFILLGATGETIGSVEPRNKLCCRRRAAAWRCWYNTPGYEVLLESSIGILDSVPDTPEYQGPLRCLSFWLAINVA